MYLYHYAPVSGLGNFPSVIECAAYFVNCRCWW